MTATELAARWQARDNHYAQRKFAGNLLVITDDEISSIKIWRRKEIDELPPDERSAAWGVYSRWTPPIIRDIR